jgi:hypothetical protein
VSTIAVAAAAAASNTIAAAAGAAAASTAAASAAACAAADGRAAAADAIRVTLWPRAQRNRRGHRALSACGELLLQSGCPEALPPVRLRQHVQSHEAAGNDAQALSGDEDGGAPSMREV